MIKENAWAKLNLNLHLLPQKLKNGFYPVKFINCQIDLNDKLLFEEKDKDIEIVCQHPQIPKPKNNLVYKAAFLLKQIVKKPKLGAKITLQKNIPVKSGLGGGSSDAAAAIKGLCKLWQIHLTEQDKHLLAGKLGKDVFYCLKGGLCEISGDSSHVFSLPFNLPTFWLLIIVSKQGKPSTEWMYKHLEQNKIGKNLAKLAKIKKGIKTKNKSEILNNLFNDFETLAASFYPVVKKMKEDLEKAGAAKTLLAGSGLSVVGFYETEEQALKAKAELTKIYPQIIYAKTK